MTAGGSAGREFKRTWSLSPVQDGHVQPLLDPSALDRLRHAFDAFTPEEVLDCLGPIGQAGLDRGDLLLAGRVLPEDDPTATLIRLFLLGGEIPDGAAAEALGGLRAEDAPALLRSGSGHTRASLEVRPYSEQDGAPCWVVSDFGSDVRPGPLAPDHVLGIGSASLTLAQYTMRAKVGRVLDVGTGCGIQALHLSTHAAQVTATDISERALSMAATTAALSGLSWDLRAGSLLEPVAGERFDLVVANPPFVVSPGLTTDSGGYEYRDSGLAGDELCRRLVAELPSVLTEGGAAQLLANWVITAEADWRERLAGWLAGGGCDAWAWQREVADPAEYVTLWLRDAGEQPGTVRWRERYDEWLDWMAQAGIVAVGMGAVTIWNNQREEPIVVLEDVPQPLQQPAGATVGAWLPRQRYLRDTDDDALLRTTLTAAPGVLRTGHDLIEDGGWRCTLTQLRLSDGMRWEVESDPAITGLLAACDGRTPLLAPLTVLAAVNGTTVEVIAEAALPVVRDLISRGFLLP